jgi:hypothetical protein
VGRVGVVPVLRLGGLTGRDIVVAIRPKSHDLGKPANLIGQDLMRGLLLRHEQGRWSLVRRTESATVTDRVTFVVPLLAPGLPMVGVRDPHGVLRYALIDTGAPMAIPMSKTPKGAWHLEGFPNAVPLNVPEGNSEGCSHLRVGEWPISLLIGLDFLSAADWVLDFEGAEWRFLAPSAPRGS